MCFPICVEMNEQIWKLTNKQCRHCVFFSLSPILDSIEETIFGQSSIFEQWEKQILELMRANRILGFPCNRLKYQSKPIYRRDFSDTPHYFWFEWIPRTQLYPRIHNCFFCWKSYSPLHSQRYSLTFFLYKY